MVVAAKRSAVGSRRRAAFDQHARVRHAPVRRELLVLGDHDDVGAEAGGIRCRRRRVGGGTPGADSTAEAGCQLGGLREELGRCTGDPAGLHLADHPYGGALARGVTGIDRAGTRLDPCFGPVPATRSARSGRRHRTDPPQLGDERGVVEGVADEAALAPWENGRSHVRYLRRRRVEADHPVVEAYVGGAEPHEVCLGRLPTPGECRVPRLEPGLGNGHHGGQRQRQQLVPTLDDAPDCESVTVEVHLLAPGRLGHT